MMKIVAVLSGLVALSSALPLELPAGVSAAAFPCYPYRCGVEADAYASVPGGDIQYHNEQRVKQQQFALSQPLVPQVPGLAAHYAAEAEVLAAQGRVPGSIVHSGAEARVYQAEADLIALQKQQAAAPAFTGLVGPSGVVGPSGLVGPAGPLAF